MADRVLLGLRLTLNPDGWLDLLAKADDMQRLLLWSQDNEIAVRKAVWLHSGCCDEMFLFSRLVVFQTKIVWGKVLMQAEFIRSYAIRKVLQRVAKSRVR